MSEKLTKLLTIRLTEKDYNNVKKAGYTPDLVRATIKEVLDNPSKLNELKEIDKQNKIKKYKEAITKLENETNQQHF